jgi:hypothetical protein
VYFQEVGCSSVGWIDPARERYRWRAYKAVNLRFTQIAGNFLSSRGYLASQEGHGSMYLVS